MAHRKAGGSTKLGRDSASKRLGVKLHDGQICHAGAIIVRQRGSRIHPGVNVKRGGDDTLYALINGKVKFATRKRKRFDGRLRTAKFVSVVTA
ncbi:50S ribosomal protein L27 [Candidatus Uhrbacteria bacterium RIFCSPLOWO2_02_FULL_51_9]|uniref:Large ribosomal subunit protein bL27 n=1 Tax=Candidatus Uhrbacteria bacterium RIFCSPLOWO2_02_FULL_51_9 TaxID=1802410 RepID=A0A1F7VF77_9BACT|nr:MAG: 50S ribosomal protein L27 [Candidatus Uhrbacteria bacterium RIFCSPLOWO2_02_FULL_51_9]